MSSLKIQKFAVISFFSVIINFNFAQSQNTSLNAPQISANSIFLYQNSNFHKGDLTPANIDQEINGFKMRETELQFFSDVDPYTRMNIILSVHSEVEDLNGQIGESWAIEPEELYVDSIYFSGFNFKFGKFKAEMGKHNLLHTHAYPFVQAPLANAALLGEAGLNDVGLSMSGLLPTSWFSEISAQYLRASSANSEFNSPSPSDGVGLMHLKNFWDLNEDLTMELGVSLAEGNNSYRKKSQLENLDLTFKWRPTSGGKYSSLIWSSEVLARSQSQEGHADERGTGFTSWIQYQLSERWSALYRFDQIHVENSYSVADLPNDMIKRHSVALNFAPSEFSQFKLEFDQKHGGIANSQGDTIENAIYLQAHFTMGSHPTHSY